ncbi:hypothetical protein ADK52_09520 [Streptomyces sp. WM6372]|nr:hypothetical protein ADK52_09520 [Streptomyces sp. WM6372]
MRRAPLTTACTALSESQLSMPNTIFGGWSATSVKLRGIGRSCRPSTAEAFDRSRTSWAA